MATYGMKDAANLTLVDKATKRVAMHIDYANATSSEWSSERVFATRKGVNAIGWDAAREGKLTLETEIFDLKLLAMTAGSDVKEGDTNVFRHERVVAATDRTLKLSATPEAGSISIFKLKADGLEHDGSEIPQELTGEVGSAPLMVKELSVTAKDTEATLTWAAPKGAISYTVLRDGSEIASPATNSFKDSGLTPEKEYTYTIVAINQNGQSPLSPVLKVTTAAKGATEAGAVVKPTTAAIKTAEEAAKAELTGVLTYSVNADGVIKLSDGAVEGTQYMVYYLQHVNEARVITISADKFPSNYEIFADAYIREQQTSKDEFIQIHYKNAKPQSNFSLSQSAKEPTNLSITFDLFPDETNVLAEYKVIA